MATIIFMGTPHFAIPTLKALIQHHQVIGVITQPDRPVGRKQILQASPVKTLALQANIPVFQPEKIRRPQTIEALKAWQPAVPDLYVVAAFGQILPQTVLELPRYGSINVHASLLPRWRGAAPIQAAIRHGDAETGITIMLMDAGLDTGPILSQSAIPIAPQETGQSLHDKLAELGAQLLIATLPQYLEGAIQPQPQPNEGITYAPQVTKEDGRIDWSQPATAIDCLIRALTPWPGTYTYWQGKQLKIHQGEAQAGYLPAGIVGEVNGRIAIGTAQGLYLPQVVQIEGKKALDIDDFIRGYRHFVGARLGD